MMNRKRLFTYLVIALFGVVSVIEFFTGNKISAMIDLSIVLILAVVVPSKFKRKD